MMRFNKIEGDRKLLRENGNRWILKSVLKRIKINNNDRVMNIPICFRIEHSYFFIINNLGIE